MGVKNREAMVRDLGEWKKLYWKARSATERSA